MLSKIKKMLFFLIIIPQLAQANTEYLPVLAKDVWPARGIVDEKGEFLFTLDNSKHLITAFQFGKNFSINKLWKKNVEGVELSYSNGFLLLYTSDYFLTLIDAKTGNTISEFSSAFAYHPRLTTFNSLPAVLISELKEKGYHYSFLNAASQTIMKTFNFSDYPQAYPPTVLFNGKFTFWGFEDGRIVGYNSEKDISWTTDLLFDKDRQLTFYDLDDMIAVKTNQENSLVYLLDKANGKIINKIEISSRYRIVVKSDKDTIYTCTDYSLAAFSKKTFDRKWIIKDYCDDLYVNDHYLFVSDDRSNLIKILSLDGKHTNNQDIHVDGGGRGNIRLKSILMKDQILALTYRAWDWVNETESSGEDHVYTYRIIWPYL